MQKKKVEDEYKTSTSKDIVLTSSGSSEDGNSTSESTSDKTKKLQPKCCRAKQNHATCFFAAAINRSQVIDRGAVIVLIETTRSLGHDPDTLAINRETIVRSRKK